MIKNKKIKGVTLLSLMITIVIILGIIITGMWVKVEEMQHEKAEKQAKALEKLGIALENYIIKYRKELLENTTITNVTSKYSPTIVELNSLGLTKTNLSERNLYGGGYITSIKLSPTGCIASGENANCILEGIVALTTPMTKNGLAGIFIDSEKFAGIAAQKIGVAAGFSTNDNPTILKGYNGDWIFENPNGNMRGTLAIKVNDIFSSSALSKYLPRDGTLSMTGNLNMNNNDILNIHNQTNNGTATLNNLIANGTSNLKGNTTLNNDLTVKGNTYLKGNLTVNGTTTFKGPANFDGKITFKDEAEFKGDIKTNNSVKINYYKTIGAYCDHNTETLAVTYDNLLLVCDKNRWSIVFKKADNPGQPSGSIKPSDSSHPFYSYFSISVQCSIELNEVNQTIRYTTIPGTDPPQSRISSIKYEMPQTKSIYVTGGADGIYSAGFNQGKPNITCSPPTFNASMLNLKIMGWNGQIYSSSDFSVSSRVPTYSYGVNTGNKTVQQGINLAGSLNNSSSTCGGFDPTGWGTTQYTEYYPSTITMNNSALDKTIQVAGGKVIISCKAGGNSSYNIVKSNCPFKLVKHPISITKTINCVIKENY